MDMISREAAIECAIDAVDDWDGGWNPNRDEYIRKYFEELPAVDAVPVVRCRDCRHGTPTKNARGEAVIKCEDICWLCRLPRLMEPDWYCADAERKEENVRE